MKAVYGNYGFWAWLRYWYLDTENYVTWMMLDKGFHDYDYTEPEHKPQRKTSTELWDSKKVANLFSKVASAKPQSSKDLTEVIGAEEIQSRILADKGLDNTLRNN